MPTILQKIKVSDYFTGHKVLDYKSELDAVKFSLQCLEQIFRHWPVKYFEKHALLRVISKSHKALNNLYCNVTVVTHERN